MDVYDLNLVSSTREVTRRNIRPAQLPNSAVIYGGLEYDLTEAEMRQEALAYQRPEAVHISSVLPGSIRGGGERWLYLPGTANEARGIHRQLTGNNINAVLLNAARGNKESFRNLDGQRKGIIHLATHGFFFEDIERDNEARERFERLGGGVRVHENPLMRSGLILSGGNNAWTGNFIEGVENGILFAYDVARMNLLGAQLVVLSACDTGLGAVNNREGVFGLQRAFKLAGAQTIIMSLWEVDDRVTADFMTTFYSNWLSGKSKQDAFKETQSEIRSRYPAPYYWAAFVLMD
jgi:CHAT domain-containing protein